jgi:hypothetical protein
MRPFLRLVVNKNPALVGKLFLGNSLNIILMGGGGDHARRIKAEGAL